MLQGGGDLQPLREVEDGLAPGQALLLSRERQEGVQGGVPPLLPLQGLHEPEGVHGHAGHVGLLSQVGGHHALLEAGHLSHLVDALLGDPIPLDRSHEVLRRVRVLGVDRAGGLQDGLANQLPLGGELLHEGQGFADLEDGDQEVVTVGDPGQGQPGLPGEASPVGAELVEDEGHEIHVAGVLVRGLGLRDS